MCIGRLEALKEKGHDAIAFSESKSIAEKPRCVKICDDMGHFHAVTGGGVYVCYTIICCRLIGQWLSPTYCKKSTFGNASAATRIIACLSSYCPLRILHATSFPFFPDELLHFSFIWSGAFKVQTNPIVLLINAAYWIAFGPHGPRAEPPPGEGKRVALGTTIGLIVSLVIFAGTRFFSRPAPKTMTKEWQEASNEYLKVRFFPILGAYTFLPRNLLIMNFAAQIQKQKAEPFSGIGSKGYSGPGMIQSPPGKPT